MKNLWQMILVAAMLMSSSLKAELNFPGLYELGGETVPTDLVSILVPVERQLSCGNLNLQFRRQLEALDDIRKAFSGKGDDQVSGSGWVWELYEYYDQVSALDLSRVSTEKILELSAVVSKSQILSGLESPLAVAAIGVSEFEIASGTKFSSYPMSVVKKEDGFEVRFFANAFDVCKKGAVELVFFGDCPKDNMDFWNCKETGICLDRPVVYWNKCKKIQKFSLDLGSYRKELGKRKGSIRRRK